MDAPNDGRATVKPDAVLIYDDRLTQIWERPKAYIVFSSLGNKFTVPFGDDKDAALKTAHGIATYDRALLSIRPLQIGGDSKNGPAA